MSFRCCRLWAVCGALALTTAGLADEPARLKATRLPDNPIIRPEMLPGKDGGNINGPSLIRVPDWLPKPLGKYFLYFADHRGRYIRLAYADRPEGPYKVHEPGTLKLTEVQKAAGVTPDLKGAHIASPDIIVDDAKQEIRIYFHCGFTGWGHNSGVAVSKDGLKFEPQGKPLGGPYFRVFQWEGHYYAIDRSASVLRSRDGLRDFQRVRPADLSGLGRVWGSIRHTAVLLDGKRLTVFFSRTGDAPECIMYGRIELAAKPEDWKLGEPIKLLEPEKGYEGIQYENKPSSGGLGVRLRQLRDPAIYREGNKTYLLYSVAGEMGIAIAELKE
jgi:hypothetical protein